MIKLDQSSSDHLIQFLSITVLQKISRLCERHTRQKSKVARAVWRNQSMTEPTIKANWTENGREYIMKGHARIRSTTSIDLRLLSSELRLHQDWTAGLWMLWDWRFIRPISSASHRDQRYKPEFKLKLLAVSHPVTELCTVPYVVCRKWETRHPRVLAPSPCIFMQRKPSLSLDFSKNICWVHLYEADVRSIRFRTEKNVF